MAAETGNTCISGTMTEIPNGKSELSTMASSIEVSPRDCDNDGQPEMVRLAAKTAISIFGCRSFTFIDFAVVENPRISVGILIISVIPVYNLVPEIK